MTELNIGTSGSKANEYSQLKTDIDAGGTSDNTTEAGAVAAAAAVESALQTAQEALATLQATTATALATKAELGKRILRAGVELTELGELANAGKTGTLDEAKKLRDAEVADYTAAGAAFKNAYLELRAATGTPDSETDDANIDVACANATCPVKARTGTDVGTGGALTEAKEVAKATLAQAVIDQATAQANLDGALGTASKLADLRKAVEDETADWDVQEAELVKAVTAIATA